jgi:feruloyl esterase
MRILLALLAASVLWAQNRPVTGCAGLRSLTNNQISVAVAVPLAETAEAPAHCRVFGQVLPQVGFEVRMPAEWNGRFAMVGNGGFAGEPTDSRARAVQYGRYLKRGYAVAATDTGHSNITQPIGAFATDRQQLLDYAFRSLHVTAEASKLVLRTYYGTAPEKSYFEGCSTGGRQGLILAQRFPNDFDGITVGAPVLNFTGTMMRFVQAAKALRSAPIATGKLPALAARIYETCDAKDGLKDGLIDDPRRCDFQPARDLPKCEAGADQPDCFTAAQIGALEKIYGEVASAGQRIFPAWPVGAEIAGQSGRSGWDPWTVHDGGPTQGMIFAENFFRYMAFGRPEPQYDLLQFDLDKDPAKMETIHQILDATDTDLSAFQQRGGKILMYFGWADPALNPMMGVEYYEAVQARMGPGTTDFFRLFMAPGMFHCGDGPGPNQFDTTGPLSDWVERGAAPQSIRASKMTGGKLARSRPLCPYPEVARYTGTGSIDDFANFTCVKP